MSSDYAGNGDNYPGKIKLPDDGDPRTAASVSTPLEDLADRTAWLRTQMTRSRLIALGELPFASIDGHFALEYNYMSLTSHTAVGDQAKVPMNRVLVHGAVVESVDLLFVPKTGHSDLPATPPQVILGRWPLAPNEGPSLPESIATGTYVPVSLADYENGEIKMVTATVGGGGHTVNVEDYLYQVFVSDEDGANAKPGGTFIAIRINYAS